MMHPLEKLAEDWCEAAERLEYGKQTAYRGCAGDLLDALASLRPHSGSSSNPVRGVLAFDEYQLSNLRELLRATRGILDTGDWHAELLNCLEELTLEHEPNVTAEEQIERLNESLKPDWHPFDPDDLNTWPRVFDGVSHWYQVETTEGQVGVGYWILHSRAWHVELNEDLENDSGGKRRNVKAYTELLPGPRAEKGNG